jgi:FixJ family two-component response regulator
MARSSTNKLKSKILVIHERIASNEMAKDIADDFGVSRQAVQWLIHNYSSVDWEVLRIVRKMEEETTSPEDKMKLQRVQQFLENLP